MLRLFTNAPTVATAATRSTRPTGFARAAGGLGAVMLIALTLATATLAAPTGALAADDRTPGTGGPGGGGGSGGQGGWPGNAPDGPAVPSESGADWATAAPGGQAASGGMVTSSAVNLRSAPNTGGDVLAVLPAGTPVQVRGAWQGGFVPVAVLGMQGFVSGDYLRDGASTGATPAETTDAPAQAAPTDNSSTPATAATAVLDGPLPLVIATDAVVAEDAARSPEIVAIIYAAADAYGQSRADMLRVAACESNLDPSAVNAPGGSYGLFQFLPSTWASTPYADQDIFDPVASANAAAWMWSVGRRAEWVCQ